MEYDGSGNVTKMTDALGSVATVAYNYRNDITSKSNALGNNSTFEYNASGNRVAIVDQLGQRTTLVVDPLGRTGQFTSPNGLSWQFDYGSFEVPTRIVHPDGTHRDTTQDSAGQMVGLTDESGRLVRFNRDAAGRETGSVDPKGNQVGIIYEDGLVKETRDQLGRPSRYEYDARGRVIRQTDALGGTVTTQYDANDRIVARTDENGNTSRWEYDKNNRIVKKINALGFATRMNYDPAGNLIEDIDSLGSITSYAYDALGRQVSTTLPDGSVTQTSYDALGNRTEVIVPRGETARFVYDAANQLIRMADPMLGVYQWSFDAAGNISSSVDPRGNTTTRRYDNRNRLIEVADALGFVTRYDLDSVGRILKLTDPEQTQTAFQYDSLGLLLSITAADGGTTQFQYDAIGNRLRTQDPLGRISLTTYDALDRPVATTDPKGAVTTMQYDPVGNLTRLTDATANATQWQYDAMNRASQRTDPLGAAESFVYDNVALACGCASANGRGNLSEYTDKLGRKTVFKYDSRNRNTEIIYHNSDGSNVDNVFVSYDASSNITAFKDNDSQLAFTYDLNGRQLTSNNAGTPGIRQTVLTSTWNSVGNRTAVTDSDGVSVQSLYDARNLLSRRTWSGPTGPLGVDSAREDFSYNGRGQTTAMQRYSDLQGNQLVGKTIRTYDSVGRTDLISHRSAVDAVMAQFDTDWNVADELAAWTIDGQRSSYEYDLTGQLTVADHTATVLPDEAYNYDATGNRIGSNKTIGANNRLLSDERFDYGYDAEGNTVSKLERATGKVQSFQFDHRNRMTHTETRSSAGVLLSSIDYRYDAIGRRISRTLDADGSGPVAPTIQTFVYDGSDIWLDADVTGTVTARYMHGDAVDQPLARYRPGEGTAWYLADHLGSVRAIANSSGNIIDRITYDSFGGIVLETSPASGDRIKFTGREWDAEAGLYYYRSRMYDPASGRFLSEDQLGFAAGDVNLNRFVGNMPGKYTDPSGNIAMAEYGGALGFSRIGIAFASGFAGYSFGYTCGYLNALTVQGLKGDEAEFSARRLGLMVGSIDLSASLTLNFKGNIGAEIFGVGLFGAGALGLSLAEKLATGEKSAEGPAVIAQNICVAVSVVGGYGVGKAVGCAGRALSNAPKGAVFSPIDKFALARGFPNDVIKQKAWDVYHRAANSKGLIIGFGDDVVNHGTKDGLDILAFSEKALGIYGDQWWYVNKAWLDGGIDAGVPVVLVSRGDDVAEALELALRTGKDTGLTREIRYLFMRGHPYSACQ